MILDDYKKLTDSSSMRAFLTNVETQCNFSSSNEKSTFLELLLKDLLTKDWEETTTTQALSVIRTLGRNPLGSDPIFSNEGQLVLMKLAGLYEPTQVKDTLSSREALKCIANCIFLKEDIKSFFEQEGIISSCQYILQSKDPLSLEAQFLTCRILFFMTVHRSDLVSQLIESNISKSIEKILSQNVALLEDPVTRKTIEDKLPINPSTTTSEALKLLFNLMLVQMRTETHDGRDEKSVTAEHFKDCLVPIFHLIFRVPSAEPQPLVPPHSQAIHALMQYPYTTISKVWKSQAAWIRESYATPEEGAVLIASTFVNLLDRAIRVLIPKGDPDHDHGGQSADSTLAPLLLVLVSLAEGDDKLKQAIAKLMLPNEKDRFTPVHEGFSLPAYLIRLMTSTMMPQTKDAVCETLFVLCDKDANKFTLQVGYGNAVGFLVNKGIAMEVPKENEQDEADINPITGQYVSSEKQPDLKDMTDEEKEREAEKLFVLFERLKKTGIIDVENPIAKAMQENQGKFEEVYSDSDSD